MKALAQFLLRLYPRAWQERYADEMADLLEQYPVTLRTLANLLGGVLDAYLHPEILPGSETAGLRIRTNEFIIACATALFGLGWMPLRYLLPTGVSQTSLQWSVAIAFTAVIAGVYPLLWGATAWRLADGFYLGKDQAVLLIVYLIGAGAADLDFLVLLGGSLVGYLVAFITVAMSDAVQEWLVRLGLAPAAVATAAMWAGIGATFQMSLPAPATWGPVVCGLVMVVAALVATWALQRGVRALIRI